MVSHSGVLWMIRDRLFALQDNLTDLYEQLSDQEKALIRVPEEEKTRIRQQIRDVKQEIHNFEQQYCLSWREESSALTVSETEAETQTTSIVQEAENLEAKATYPEEAMSSLGEILTKLKKPGTPATGKLKAAIPLLPGLVRYEIEVDTERLLRRLFPTFSRLLGNVETPNQSAIVQKGKQFVKILKWRYKSIVLLSLASVAFSGGVLAYKTPCLHFLSIGNFNPFARLCNPKLARQITILVADFEGEELDNYRVTDTILKNLKLATADYLDVRVKALGKTITEEDGSEVARKLGQRHNAAIILWGWYDKTETTVPTSVNFEVLAKPKEFPELGEEARGKVRTATRDELENFTIQTKLSQEMSYLTLVTLGLSRYAIEDWDGTIDLLTDALAQEIAETSTLNPGVYRSRGNAYRRQQKYDKAIADYNRALALEPNHRWAYVNRGNAYRRQQKYDKAIADYNRALALEPNHRWAYVNRGLVHYERQEYDKAIADYNRALTLEPNYRWAYVNRGLVHYERQEYDQAIADYNRALVLEPNYQWAYVNRGNAYRRQQEYDKAIADYNRALTLEPHKWTYINRGILYHERQEYNKAIADYNRALNISPDYVKAYKYRSRSYSNKQEYAKAISDCNRALEIDPDDTWTYTTRGEVYFLQGNIQKAISDFQKALELTDARELIQEVEQQLRELQ